MEMDPSGLVSLWQSHGVATGPEPFASDCVGGKERVGS